jgi:hypothetical protein
VDGSIGAHDMSGDATAILRERWVEVAVFVSLQ